MPRLTTILKHGFDNDDVVVRVNGARALDRRGVSTRTTVDRATAFDLDLPEGPVRLEIEVPSRRLSRTLEFALTDRRTVLISIVDGPRIDTQIVEGLVGDA